MPEKICRNCEAFFTKVDEASDSIIGICRMSDIIQRSGSHKRIAVHSPDTSCIYPTFFAPKDRTKPNSPLS